MSILNYGPPSISGAFKSFQQQPQLLMSRRVLSWPLPQRKFASLRKKGKQYAATLTWGEKKHSVCSLCKMVWHLKKILTVLCCIPTVLSTECKSFTLYFMQGNQEQEKFNSIQFIRQCCLNIIGIRKTLGTGIIHATRCPGVLILWGHIFRNHDPQTCDFQSVSHLLGITALHCVMSIVLRTIVSYILSGFSVDAPDFTINQPFL